MFKTVARVPSLCNLFLSSPFLHLCWRVRPMCLELDIVAAVVLSLWLVACDFTRFVSALPIEYLVVCS